MIEDVIESAVAEARRRGEMSERDVSGSVAHVERALPVVCRDEGLTPDSWFSGGAGMPTLAVTTADGTAAVLKLDQPGLLDVQAQVMLAADGHGYARVLTWNPSLGALLTERLGDTLWTEARSLEAQTAAILPVLREAWDVPIEVGSPFVGKAAGLRTILADLGPRYGSGHPWALARAEGYATALATSEQPEVVCHGDPHAGNVLRRGGGWALIDPDGFVGERAYDLGVVLRDACREIEAAEATTAGSGAALLDAACHRLGPLAGVDPGRVWRWAYVERVTTGLYLCWHGYPEEAASFLATADLLLR
ncbi:aminoglycoside phosphotransferase family protein [Lapillicoccus sp.]|uniref:aminoglycoside phosphotransferase family protein n=1 Tax=Lapillicoccus sp. TaxID=1909287 RepID=UPI0025EDDB32|nr:aminoglycoside phosphotransferase family protein [Lapillicoccus sp.]